MRIVAIAAALFGVATVLSACQYFETAREYAGEGGAYGVTTECSLSTAERRKNLDSINKALEEQGSTARVVPFDCDGDGMADEI